MTLARSAIAIFSLFLLSSCGGDSSSSGGNNGGGSGGVATNTAPTFTSGTSFSFEEQFQDAAPRTIVQLSANDADGDALTFGIANTKDGSLFSFNGQEGALAFSAPPSFETAADGNEDNIYEVDVTVSDGRATTTQTISVEVTNSLEGLTVRRLVSNLNNGGFGGALHYVDETNELLVLNSEGRIFRINATTGATISSALTNAILPPDAEILGIVSDGASFRGNNFFALTRTQTILRLLYVNAVSGASSTLWVSQPGGPVTASLGLRGNNALVAISDGGNPSAAQDRNDVRGNLLMMVGSGDPTSLASYSVTPQTVGLGLRSPRLFTSTNLAARSVFDRGEAFNEYNEADFEISQSSANFEWPARDGETDRNFAGTLTGDRITPRVVQDLSPQDVGQWLAGADSLQGTGWFGVLVISDDLGNIFTFGAANGEPLENRNLDFRSAGLGNRPIVSMDDADTDIGNATPIFMLDDEGSVFVVDLSP